MSHFLRQFWQSFALVLLVLVMALSLGWHSFVAKLPPRPPLWTGGPTYLSEYSFHGSVSHYIYRFGLFGVGDRVRNSDVLLIGSSHVEYGLSARVLADQLSRAAGRPVQVYNLGLGFSEGIGFAKAILEANRVRKTAVILDLFTEQQNDELSDYGRIVDQSNRLGARLKVYDLWLRYDEDWLLDPYLPRFSPRSDEPLSEAIKPTRALGIIAMRDWATGDAEGLWAPKLGWMFGGQASSPGTVFDTEDPYGLRNHPNPPLSPAESQYFQSRELLPIFTLVPFDGSYYLTPSPTATPYLQIPGDGLFLYDRMHLTSVSRDVATLRLFGELERSGLASGIESRR